MMIFFIIIYDPLHPGSRSSLFLEDYLDVEGRSNVPTCDWYSKSDKYLCSFYSWSISSNFIITKIQGEYYFNLQFKSKEKVTHTTSSIF